MAEVVTKNEAPDQVRGAAAQFGLADASKFFWFAVATSLISVFVVTILAAVLVGLNMPETFDLANTREDHWAVVGIVGYMGLILFLPIAVVVWLIGWLPFRGVIFLGGGPVLGGALVASLPWSIFSGWLVQEFQSTPFWGLTVVGALIGAGVARVMNSWTGTNLDARQRQNWQGK